MDEQTQNKQQAVLEADLSAEVATDCLAHSGTDADFCAPIDPQLAMRVLEAALLSTTEPLNLTQLRRLFVTDPGPAQVQEWLQEMQEMWTERGAQLSCSASGWRFQTPAELQIYLDRMKEVRPPKYSRAVMETLAIIAYRQPVTRGDIEDVRGVAVATNVLKSLEARGWIDVIGHRDAPGRPALYATTKKFLDDLGLRTLTELPPLAEIEGVLDLVDRTEAA